jgi:endonuclease/exonuclease/phosphatase family metal-dependent hydrolase
MRFATWNLDWWNRSDRPDARVALLESSAVDLVALQEVSAAVVAPLRESHDGPLLFSQEVYAEATWRWMGCGLVLPPGTEVLEAGVVTTLPKPQRSLWAKVELPELGVATVVSWHAPNAAGDGRDAKMLAYREMSRWLTATEEPLLLGADINSWRDPVTLLPADLQDPFADEHAFVGPSPRHGLVDAYREHLQNTGELARLHSGRPTGPLAVSHVLSNGAGHRMDRIFISADFDVRDAAYDLQGALQAGSDHALHWVNLTTR